MSFIKVTKKEFRKLPFYRQIWSAFRLKKIPIENIRCQIKPFSETLGFSGKTIDYFPPCKFYEVYLENTEKAHQLFKEWIYHYLMDVGAWKISKEEGGWKNGSLIELIYDIHKNNGIDLQSFNNASQDFIKKAIELKVKYYFDLLNSIREKGYIKSQPPSIMCYFMNNRYYLTGGHHRVSALYVLGIKDVYVQVINRDK